MRFHGVFGAAALAAVIGLGCATTRVPNELMDARETYNRVAKGPAASVLPAELYEAKQSLDRAEKAFVDDDERSRDLAYLAERRAELVESRAKHLVAQRDEAAAQHDLQNALRERAAQSEAEIRRKEQELDRAQRDVQSAQSAVATEKQRVAEARAETEAERNARKDAERKLDAAIASLERVAQVKEEARGTVITLSGAVLFASGQHVLLPIAQEKLNQVAEALKASEQQITIEGHTDSVGSDTENQGLSQRRADAVREYLVSRGIPAERIRAAGIGEARPVADNMSAEGRANNRRVEIILAPAKR